ncbi:hypothetical protein [Halanaeroarchaeum sulfurireducens]|uniref:Polysaccharide biosynthesis protein n=1 Tax=Halanaeroarchaeum sulfurireducens TaxID=1604004 RepID=A0A0F7PA39_9EURY|nr:hypothetical protein [Halanaeroarchaeum sulfurireducens]AKH98011.1 polysaccharide biosynthesis protein [Halanaeroarchaeum sulfurireducens]ALG82405.1 polysaccharide biosynthesis protein [Halanaeroarchaeum sulfurireducens]
MVLDRHVHRLLSFYGPAILRFGGIEEEEVMLVLSFEERFDVNLGLLKDVAKLWMG